MKRRPSGKSNAGTAQAGSDITGMIGSIQRQLVTLEMKLDALISRSAVSSPHGEKRFPTLFANNAQQTQSGPRRDERKDNNFSQRVLHKAICADCNKQCEVPFKPTGDRPVYCKECFSKRKNSSSFKPHIAHFQARPGVTPARHPEKSRFSEASRPERKKRPSTGKKKRRS